MSGLEAAAAVGGLIGVTITVIDASIQIYDAVKDKSGIPEKLRKVSDTLPSLIELLKGAQAQFDKDQPSKQAWIEVEQDVKRCHSACQELHDILESAYPKADAGTVGRVFKNMGNLVSRKSKTAEQLLKEIHGYLEILKQRQIITNATLLDDIKTTVDELFPRPGLTQNNVSGTNIGGDGQVFYNNNTGSGQQFTGNGGNFTFNNTSNELNEDFVRMKLQEWLRFPSIDYRRAAITKAHEDTFRWILSPTLSMEDHGFLGSDFVEWLRKGRGVYWIQGKMGCGKSTLMKYVTGQALTQEYLREWAKGQTLHHPSYYFSKTGTSELQKSLQGLYRTLLATLLQHEKSMFRVAFPAWQLSDSHHEPTSAVLRDALENVLTHSGLSCKYCFFIDGLDEYEETDNGLKGELAKDILGLARLSDVKLVVSSRPEPMFKLKFAHCQTMELHHLTGRDIAAYVNAEVRREATPHDLTLNEHEELQFLCDEVIWKAGGVFLWVTIAVASILNGIVDYETLPELRSRLNQLDPRLTVLFKQVLVERVQTSHRKSLARSLLAEGRTKSRLFTDYPSSPAIFQAIIPCVDASHDYSLLLDGCEINARVSDVQRRLPGRSCGLYLDSGAKVKTSLSRFNRLRPLKLSHSSLYEFLSEDATRTLLLEQAGVDFRLDEAIVVGRMADLVHRMERKQNYDGIDSGYLQAAIEIMHTIEMSEISTDLMQTKLISTFDKIFFRDFGPCNLVVAGLPIAHWDPLYKVHTEEGLLPPHSLYSDAYIPRPQGVSCHETHGSDLLSLTISFGLSCYLKHEIDTCRGIPHKTGTPLLFYPLWSVEKFLGWTDILCMINGSPYESNQGDHPGYIGPHDGECHTTTVKLLLAQGADPNELCHGITPWCTVLRELCSARGGVSSVYRIGPPDAFPWSKEFFCNKLDVAQLMLEHGADPFLCLETSDHTISPHIFVELLEDECCSGNAVKDCICDYARQIQPRLTELANLVDEQRCRKRQMRIAGGSLVQAGWLVWHWLTSCKSS